MGVDITTIKVTCQDGYQLVGSLFTPQGPSKLKAGIMIAPATGIKRQFYASFAQHLSEQGYGVLTFDNRGIGQSVIGHVSKVRLHYSNGASKTCPQYLTH